MTPGDRLLNFALSDAQGVRRIFYFEVAGAPSVFFAAESFRSPELAEALQDFPAQLDRLRGAGLEVYFLSRDEPAVLRGLTEAWGTDAAAFSDPGGQVLERLLAPEPPAFPETRPFRPKLATFALDPNQRTLAVFRRPPLGDHVSGCLEAVETWHRGAAVQHSRRLLAPAPHSPVLSGGSAPERRFPQWACAGCSTINWRSR